MVTTSCPRVADGFQDGLHFVGGKKAKHGTYEALDRNGHDPLDVSDHFRSLAGAGIADKGTQRGQTHITGSYAVTTRVFEILQELD